MKKFGALLLLLFAFLSISPAHAEVQGKNPKLILDTLSEQEVSDLNIVVPRDTEPGYQVLTIQVYDDTGVLSERHVYFCKDVDGSVHWDNICPDIAPIATEAELSKIAHRGDLPKYLAPMESKKHSKNFLIAVGLLLLTINFKSSYKDAATAAIESLEAEGKKIGQSVRHWGDRSFTWKFFFRAKVDRFFTIYPENISRRSLLLARIMGDGDYARAMFGSLSTLPYFAGIAVGWFAAKSVSFQALPPHWNWLLALILLGIFDTFSGFLGALIYAGSVISTGHINNLSTGLTVFSVSMLFFAPVLTGSAARQFRRMTTNSPERWEKLVDYALAPVIGGWLVNKIIEGLNAVAHLQLEITYYARVFGAVACAALLLRMFAEEFAHRVYTWRLSRVSIEYAEQTRPWEFLLAIGKFAISVFLAAQFIGMNKYLLAGMAFVAVPKFLNIAFGDKTHRSPLLHRALPKGIFLSVVMLYFGAIYQVYLRAQFTNPSDYLRWSFLLVAIPGFLISLLNLFAKRPERIHWSHGPVARYPWRVGGVLVYLIFLAIVLNINIPDFYHHHLQHVDWAHFVRVGKDQLGLN